MVNALVCIKRVPDVSGQVLLTADAMGVDARHVGHTVSPHELAAVELAVQSAEEVTVLSIGAADAVEQLREAVAVGAHRAVLVEVDPEAFGPRDIAKVIAEVVGTDEAEAGRGQYDLVLLGNDAADTGDFQVGVRVGYALGRPVVTGASLLTVEGDRADVVVEGPEGREVYELPVPAVVTVMEGGVAPRYPSVVGRMKAKKAPVDVRSTSVHPQGSGRRRLTLPPEQPSEVTVIGEGAAAAPALVDLLESLGVLTR